MRGGRPACSAATKDVPTSIPMPTMTTAQNALAIMVKILHARNRLGCSRDCCRCLIASRSRSPLRHYVGSCAARVVAREGCHKGGIGEELVNRLVERLLHEARKMFLVAKYSCAHAA